jgi:group II intron reverse transcriptase/maturase
MRQTKLIEISKHEVVEAYNRVKANKGSAGIDHQSLQDFERDKSNNLYKLWNRMSSGSYMPPPVLRVEIPKGDGGMRALGIPTITDRIAQMVVKQRIEPELEQHFHPNSYGYRPNKSALEAIALTRERCWKRAWVLDMDIKGFFDEINHELLMRAVNKHVPEKWMKLYIERWLKAPVQHRDEQPKLRDKGTPQGGVISPLLANLYLHYVFDTWVEKHWTGIQFERYADDIVCHCASEQEAQQLKIKLEQRFIDCGLTLHPKKTKIAYCKSSNNRGHYPQVSFDFLGHTFKPRLCKNKQGKFFVAFTPAISRKSAKKVRDKIASWTILRNSKANLNSIAYYSRAILQGWKNYYGKYGRAELKRVLFYLNEKLVRWAKKKYKRLKTERRAVRWIIGYRQREPKLFVHWSFT